MRGRAHWTSVPMPPGVAALSRTPGGIPITYTVAWTSEKETRLRPEPLLKSLMGHAPLAIFSSGRPGLGSPKLSIVETSRLRRSMIRGACQVCASSLPRGPRWIANFSKDQSIDFGGKPRPLLIDAWTCEPCLRYSLQVCPELLNRRRSAGGVTLMRLSDYRLVAVRERPESIPAEALSEIPVGAMKVAAIHGAVGSAEEFLARQFDLTEAELRSRSPEVAA